MARIQFITDSAADIPRNLAAELDILVLPFSIATESAEYLDGVDLTPKEFYTLLLESSKIPTHAQLTPFYLEEVFAQSYAQGYSHVIYTAINSKSSNTHQNVVMAREAFFENNPQAADTFSIQVIDSLNYTMGYGYAVVEGAKMAAGGATPADICAFIQDWVDHVRVLFAPFDLKFAKKSGRVSAAAAFVGEALGLKPVMTFENGESKILTKVRGEKAVISTLVELCAKNRQPESPYLVIRANNDPQADALVAACSTALGDAPALEYFIGGVISINAGPNLVGLIYRQQ